MTSPYFLQSLELAGFRAYLQPVTFNFKKKQCLAIFAPNGNGKSSFVDAIEFILSGDGTLDRLGQRAVNNQAGPIALAHNMAADKGIIPSVTITAAAGKKASTGSRPASGAKRPIPAIAVALNACFAVPPIIRGHSLRAFVESDKPEQGYTDVATWLQLGPLAEVQKNMRSLRMQVKAAAEDVTPLQRIDRQLARDTSDALKTWDTAAVLSRVNTSVLAPLDPLLTLATLNADDPVYLESNYARECGRK